MMAVNYRRIIATLTIFAGLSFSLYSCSNKSTWKEAKKTDTYEAYRSYIKKHPDGKHIAEARNLAETRYWDAIRNDTTKSFQTYLTQFPEGEHRLNAKIALSKLSPDGNNIVKAKVTGSSVIIRSNHTSDSPSVGVVAREGTIVQVLDWNRIGNNNGAVLKKPITVVSNEKQISLNQGKALQVLVDLKDSVKVSFATSYDGSVEAIISKKVIETMSGKTWFKIKTNGGITGWIYGEFIEVL